MTTPRDSEIWGVCRQNLATLATPIISYNNCVFIVSSVTILGYNICVCHLLSNKEISLTYY